MKSQAQAQAQTPTTPSAPPPPPPFSLSASGILVCYSVSQWGAKKEDRNASSESAAKYEAERQMVSLQKLLLDPKTLAGMRKVASEARVYHYLNTLPWERGKQFLPAKKSVSYTSSMQAYKLQFDEECAKFFSVYSRRVEETRKQLGKLFNASDYPSEQEIRRLFGFRISFEPVPEASSFLVDVTDDLLREWQEDLILANQEREISMRRELWERLYAPVSKMCEKLSEEDSIFRNSLVTNIKEVADSLHDLNIFNDPQLEDMARVLSSTLARLDPDILRENPESRERAVKDARRAMDKMTRAMRAFAPSPSTNTNASIAA